MNITLKWLEDKKACREGVDWFKDNFGNSAERVKVLKKLIKESKLSWANWTIVRTMVYKQYVSYAVFAAEQVIDIYEKKYPNDNRPRKAIEAAKKCIKYPTRKNKDAAYAAYAAYAAADAAAYAADAAAYAAAYAADAAKKMRLKILRYGLKMLQVEEK